MASIFMLSVLFCIAFGQATSMCVLTEYTMFVEKKECGSCLAINTTICSGFCLTRDPNLKGSLPKNMLSQNACSYDETIYRTIYIPDCPLHANPFYTYPVAKSCKCDKCNTDYSDCVQDPVKTNYCTKPKKPHYIGFSNHIE